jgi:hypothetical protein
LSLLEDLREGGLLAARAHLRELAGKVSKTNETLGRATRAYYESRKLLATLEIKDEA